jgi:hypothetical protein
MTDNPTGIDRRSDQTPGLYFTVLEPWILQTAVTSNVSAAVAVI